MEGTSLVLVGVDHLHLGQQAHARGAILPESLQRKLNKYLLKSLSSMSRSRYEFAGNIWEQSDRCELCQKRDVVKIHQLSESCITCNLAAHAFNIDLQSKELSKYRWFIPGLVTATGRLSGGWTDDGGKEGIDSRHMWNSVAFNDST